MILAMTFNDSALHVFPGATGARVCFIGGFAAIEFSFLGVGEGDVVGIEAIPQVLDEKEAFGGAEIEQGGVFCIHGRSGEGSFFIP
jgi:hypothetical protein